MNTDNNLSLLIPSQLPDYIVSDPAYANFVTFLQAYYEWMEQEHGALYGTKNILTLDDIDTTTTEFLQYFCNDFLQHFPKETLVDKTLALKVAKELYRSKGTPASYQFLFRVLFNSDFDIFFTKDAVFKASDGVWYISKSLKLATTNPDFLNINNYKIFGETSKSSAIIENSVFAGVKTEVFISNIERLFQSGEMVRILDSNNQDVLSNGLPMRAKLVGQINQIKINPKNRGLLYAPGDPVIVYGGLNQEVEFPVGALAHVGQTTTGSIQRINVIDGGFGYNLFPNTLISITDAHGALANVSTVTDVLPPAAIIQNPGSGYLVDDVVIKGNTESHIVFADITGVNETGGITSITYRSGLDANTVLGITANVISRSANASNALINISSVPGNAVALASYIVKDTISLKTKELHPNHENGFLLGNTSNPVSYYFSKMPTANINTKLSDAFSFEEFFTYSISSVNVDNGGGNIAKEPKVTADAIYITDVFDPTDSANTLGQNIQGKLSNLGILSPIQIANPGVGYRLNDVIHFTGGSGYGANAKVTAISSSGGITEIQYVYSSNTVQYCLGGMGYTAQGLPSVNVNSANSQAYGAQIFVPGILGSGAKLKPILDRVGSVTSITIDEYGEDYVATPNVSLRVQDILVSNAYIGNLPKLGDTVYQGTTINTASYVATVNSISSFAVDSDPYKTLYSLRVFNYNHNPKPQLALKVANKGISMVMANTAYTANSFFSGSPEFNENGIKSYGDGSARATASFLNGLVVGQGQYLSTKGQPSAFSVLQNENYNNYTYQITVEAEISKYRDVLLNLLHPTGMKVIGRYAIKSKSDYGTHSQTGVYTGKTLAGYTGYVASSISINSDFTNISNNIVKFNNLAGANIANFIFDTSTLIINPLNNYNINSEVLSVDYANNQVVLKDNLWLTFPNVAYVSGNVGSNTLSVNSLTGTYDLINNGNYSNTKNHLQDVVFSGDRIKINNDVYTIEYVDYEFQTITLTQNLSSNIHNNAVSINRTMVAGGSSTQQDEVIILGPLGETYIPQLSTEDGLILTTEDQRILILG